MHLKNGTFLILGCLAFFVALADQTEETIKEAISVVNVEVPLRVFADGQSVGGLGKEDFEILEDGKPQLINGFYSFHKKMKPPAEATSAATPGQPLAGRYFVLIFRTYVYNGQLENGLQYLFNSIFRPGDQVLVIANNRTLMIEQLGANSLAQNKIAELIRSESQAARNQMLNYVRSIEQSLNMTKFRMTLGGRTDLSPDYLANFLDSYLQAWQEFKRRYLALEIDKFYYFSRHLEKVKKEKWVLNFYQLEQFPQIAFGGDIETQLRNYIGQLDASDNPTIKAQGRNIERLLQAIAREMKVAEDFPAEEASKLFYKVNATFHSFFMHVFLDADSSEMQFRNVATDIENSLRSLTEATGGTLTVSNKVDAALSGVSEKTDDCYVLTYEPASTKKIGKIKVTAKDRRFKVLYDNNIRADYINEYLLEKEAATPIVKIKELQFAGKKLSFVISDYSPTRIQDETSGRLSVRIRIKNAKEQSVFDQSKNMQASKKNLSLSMEFGFLTPGKYDIIVDVLDQVSSKTCTELIQPRVE